MISFKILGEREDIPHILEFIPLTLRYGLPDLGRIFCYELFIDGSSLDDDKINKRQPKGRLAVQVEKWPRRSRRRASRAAGSARRARSASPTRTRAWAAAPTRCTATSWRTRTTRRGTASTARAIRSSTSTTRGGTTSAASRAAGARSTAPTASGGSRRSTRRGTRRGRSATRRRRPSGRPPP